ncbi:MAG TPA: thioredoxin [Anaerolineales bacterium]|nr:thioredoxin [Anaerolineales bacterium]
MSSHIVNVNESDFQAEVLLHSNQRPVVVDFWADWCVPCRTLDPILEKLTEEANGAFRLAKVDVDANPKVANDYGVRGIPAIKVFRNGQVVAEFSGLRPEPQVREFIKALAPATSDLNVGRADSLLTDEEWSEAEEIYRQVLDENPDHPGSLLGLARSLIAEGASSQALPILRAFPVSKEYAKAEQLVPLAQTISDFEGGEFDEENDDPLAAQFYVALRLASRGQIFAAMDGLLDILRRNKKYRQVEIRRLILGFLVVLGDENPQTRAYRAELTGLLF